MEQKHRESNIELLRIVLMALIIIWHYMIYGQSLLSNLVEGKNINLSDLITTPMLVFPVDCFVFISGYFGIKLRRKSLISFLILMITYSIITYCLASYFSGTFKINYFIASFFPVSADIWWFFTLYIMLMCLSPLLNRCMDWDKQYFKKMLIIYAVFLLGIIAILFGKRVATIGDLGQFIFIYLLGRYVRKYPDTRIIKYRWILFLGCLTANILFLTLFVRLDMPSWIMKPLSYNNPLVVACAVFIFLIFKNLKIKYSKTINIIGSTVFATYLVTESNLRLMYNNLIMDICGQNYCLYILAAFTTILLISPIELLRKKFTEPLINKLSKISKKLIP